jgi:hypothetical protein
VIREGHTSRSHNKTGALTQSFLEVPFDLVFRGLEPDIS